MSARLLDDSEHRRQTKARALVRAFVGEERLEQAVARGPVHAAAGVREGNEYMPAGMRLGMHGHVSFIEDDIGRLDRELTANGHGVARVHGQVHDYLLKLADVHLDGPKIVGAMEMKIDVLT